VGQALSKLKCLGFNVVRLVVQWKGLAPKDATVAESSYLDAIRIVVERLFQLGIYSLIDFHQDIAYEGYGGDGFPDWAIVNPPAPPPYVKPSGAWGLRLFRLPLPSWPLVFPELYQQVRNTLTAFWNNNTRNHGRQLRTQEKLIATIQKTAETLKDLHGIIGYEAFNEPAQVTFTKKVFEEKYLRAFYDEVIRRIAEVDPQSAVFVEPRVDWNYFSFENEEVLFDLLNFIKDPATEAKTYLPTFQGEKTVFAFHYYDLATALLASIHRPDNMSAKRKLWSEMFKVMMQEAHKRDLIPFLTEYGCDYSGAWLEPAKIDSRPYETQAAAYMDLSLQLIEASLVNSTLWVFDLYNTAKHNDNWNDESGSILDTGHQLHDPRIIARPYPMRSSAKPTQLSFDSSTENGVITMEETQTSSDAPSVIFVPDEYHYDHGFEVHYTSGEVKWDPVNHLLFWAPDRSQARHQIVICPKNGFNKNALPQESLSALAGSRAFDSNRRSPGCV
jgi:hypothetical protein